MKNLLLTISLSLFTCISFAQSTGMTVLNNRFKGEENVHHFEVGGWLARAAFSVAGEQEYKEAFSQIKNIELITIPKDVFAAHHVSVQGYKSFLAENKFEQLMEARDNGEVVTVYAAPTIENNDRYIVVVDGSYEVVVIELKGSIDASKLPREKINVNSL